MKNVLLRLTSLSAAMTRGIGSLLGKSLPAGSILMLEGILGSGKTVFVQGLAQGLKVDRPDEVRSPTFIIVQEHPSKKGKSLCHADLYRISSAETRMLGLEEYWGRNKKEGRWVVAVEWADKAAGLFPAESLFERILKIKFRIVSPNKREITFKGGKSWKKIIFRCKKIKTKKSWR